MMFDAHINELVKEVRSPGELNYIITKLCPALLEQRKLSGSGVSYADFNGVIGVLENVKLEFYRTVVAPYEEQKKLENGNISSLDL